jgi:pseudouridine kinase
VRSSSNRHDSARKLAVAGRVIVVGGANLDVFGFSAATLSMRDSNPGCIQDSPGGVARNIAENLARLGCETHLITAFGSDANSIQLADSCTSDGILIEASLIVDHIPGSRYLAILDDAGDLALAVSDMRALDYLTPSALSDRRTLLDSADLIVADTNLPAETLVWLARESQAPLLLDPVSARKASRAAAALPQVNTLKLNSLEAGTLLGRKVDPDSEDEVVCAVDDLVGLGVERVFLTLGPLGVLARDTHGTARIGPGVVQVANATGAGDAFTAGVAYAMLEGLALEESAAFGSAMAAIALTSTRTVSESINLTAVRSAMKEMLS